MSSSYHIPFPRNFLAVNTPVKKSKGGVVVVEPTPVVQPQQFDHGFLSNRPATLPRHQSVSSISSTGSVESANTVSAPSSPPTKAADSPVLGAKVFTPLPVNTKHAYTPVAVLTDMTPVARSAFLSNRY